MGLNRGVTSAVRRVNNGFDPLLLLAQVVSNECERRPTPPGFNSNRTPYGLEQAPTDDHSRLASRPRMAWIPVHGSLVAGSSGPLPARTGRVRYAAGGGRVEARVVTLRTFAAADFVLLASKNMDGVSLSGRSACPPARPGACRMDDGVGKRDQNPNPNRNRSACRDAAGSVPASGEAKAS